MWPAKTATVPKVPLCPFLGLRGNWILFMTLVYNSLMKLVFIYGPPAAGKYTTGKELARITKFKFFHNHLTVPAVESIFFENQEKRTELLKKLRELILSNAAEEKINTIFTMAYSGKIDDKHVKRIVQSIEKHGGQVCFVQLYAPKEKLLKRIGNNSRKKLGLLNKPTSKKHLLERLKNGDPYDSVKYEHLLIDTTQSSAKQSAGRIVDCFKLI
jgi:shikimate kinase